MVYEDGDRVQRGLNYAIVDEVDSILIDEAHAVDHLRPGRRPHRDVPPDQRSHSALKKQIGEADPAPAKASSNPGDFTADEKSRQVVLTEAGHEMAEKLLAEAGLIGRRALRRGQHLALMHHLLAGCAPTTCSTRTRTYVCKTAKWSSWTNSPAA